MAEMKATYHLPPNFSTPPPPAGPFQLGTVVRNFDRREQMRPLNQSAEDRVVIPEAGIFLDHKGGFEATRARLKSGELGIWAQFLGFDGIGAEASLSAKQSETDTYKFAAVDTVYFYPSKAYISQIVELSDVQEYLKGTDFKKPVYLITGLKIARGASVHLREGTEISTKLGVGLNIPGFSNLKAGPKLEGSLENSTVMSFTESSDIVVGIQCVKLYYKKQWFGSNKSLNDEIYLSGATFVDDSGHKEQERTDNYILARPEDLVLPGHISRSQTDDETGMDETWIVPV